MSEFKFSCPNCQQNIAATSEYSGAQINCPVCQTPIVVPADPAAPSDNPLAPAVPGHGPKLTMAASTTQHGAAGTSFASQAPPVRKKKNRNPLYFKIAGFVCGFALVTIFWTPISNFGRSTYTKYVHHEDVPLIQQAPTNEPPPPPPELSTEEILQNVGDKYKSLANYVVKGQGVGAIDISGIQAGQPVQNFTQAISLEMGRTNLYRLQWETVLAGTTSTGEAWSAGKGDYVGYSPYPATKAKNRETAMATVGMVSQAQCVTLVHLFFDQTNSVARLAAAFAKTNGPDLATKINGRDCYVLDGEFDAHDLVLWVDKETFLIPQVQFVFGGRLDETKLKGMRPADKSHLTYWAKLKGTVTETYGTPVLATNMVAAAFETEFAPTTGPEGQQAQSRPALARPRGASPTSPTQLTRRIRPEQSQ